MATYKVKPGQNLFDIAILLYGNIEGIFDLLISNRTFTRANGAIETLGMATQLATGDILEYHDYYIVNSGIVREIKENGYLPANAERHVYHKSTSEELVMVIAIDDEATSMGFKAAGDGQMVVDWGDNSDLETITLSTALTEHSHYFNSVVKGRRVKVYGTFTMTMFDASGIPGMLLPVKGITVDEFTSVKNKYPLTGLLLFEGTYAVDLTGATITDLTPIGNMDLQTLDFRDALIGSEVIDAYLVYVVANYGTRRPCKVWMTTPPTEIGMAAIETIIGEDDWNQSGDWEFDINGTIYKHES